MSNFGKAEYFAFISHKNTETQFALKLQRFIELYRLPVYIRKRTGGPKRLSPLCSYEVDFSSNPLMEEMNNKLRQSKFLIILCSEELIRAGSKYVDYEIRTFIECKKAEGIDPCSHIIPVIVSGEYGSADHECCPEALRELGDSGPIAIDRKKCKNDREVFLRVISGMLDIDYAVLENRDRKRQHQRCIAAGTAAAAVLAAGLALGEYYLPRKYHYQDYVMKNGLPVGIEQLSADEYRKMTSHYVITYRKHRIESLEYVNAQGSRVNHKEDALIGDRPSGYRFTYTADGLGTVTYLDRADDPYFIMQYSSDTLATADLKNAHDSNELFYVRVGYATAPYQLLADPNNTNPTEISRFSYQYDSEGYIKKVMFCSDSSGRLAQDNSIYGMEYVRDALGRVTELYYLDAQGARRVNSAGVYCRQITYNEENLVAEWQNIDRNGIGTPDAEGLIRVCYSYDDNRNLAKAEFKDQNGDLMFADLYGAAVQIYHYNDDGLLEQIDFLDQNGSMSTAADFCSMAFTYDESGYPTRQTYLDASGEPVVESSVGYASAVYENDDVGRALVTAYLDAAGEPVVNVEGYAKKVTEYSDSGRLLKYSYFDIDGSAADYLGCGYSVEAYTYDEQNRETSIAYYDGDGAAVNVLGSVHGSGFHKIETVYEYGDHTKQIIRYLDKDGQPVNYYTSLGEMYARAEMVFQGGEITAMVQYDADGNPWGDIIQSETEYSPEAEQIVTMRQLDAQKNLILETVTTYRMNGVISSKHWCEYAPPGELTSELIIQYDDGGNEETVESLYYEGGRLTERIRTHYAEDRSYTLNYVIYDEHGGQTEYDYRYDSDGNRIS